VSEKENEGEAVREEHRAEGERETTEYSRTRKIIPIRAHIIVEMMLHLK
jgi:hypothetical protein